MEDYKKVYIKLFNSMTDLTAETKKLIGQMEDVQRQCEEIVMDFGDDLPSEMLKEGEAT